MGGGVTGGGARRGHAVGVCDWGRGRAGATQWGGVTVGGAGRGRRSGGGCDWGRDQAGATQWGV